MICQLLLEPIEPLAERRERDAVRLVFGLVPARTEPELDRPSDISSTWATLIASGPGRRNVADVTSVPRRIVAVSRAMPAERHPCVGRARHPVAAHGEVVVAAEERAEPEGLGAPGDGQEFAVGGALLRFGEDAKVGELHRGMLRARGGAAEPVRWSARLRAMAALHQHGRPVADVIAELTAKRANDVKWADGPHVQHGLRRWAVRPRGRRAGRAAVPARERAEHAGVPVAAPDPVRRRGLDGRPAARRRRRAPAS